MARPKKSKFNPRYYLKTNALIFGIAFGVVGLLTILIIFAAGSNYSLQPEGGMLSGNVSVGSDPGASNLSFIQFGARSYNVPNTLAADCSADVAIELNTWLDSIPNGSIINFPNNACYLTESGIKFDNKQNWIVNGRNSTFKRLRYDDDRDNMRHVHLSNVKNFLIKDINVLGRKPVDSGYVVAVEGQMGVGIFGGENVEVDNFDVQHVHGDFVYINKYQGISARNITVKNSTFSDAGRQGIAIIDVDGAIIKNNFMTNVDRYMVDVEPGGTSTNIANFTFDGNQTSGGGLGWLSGEGAGGGITNMVLSNNIVTGPMTIKIDPPSTFRRGPISIINNTSLKEAGGDLIQLHAIDGVLVKDNKMKLKLNGAGNPALTLVHLYDSTDAKIINNITDNALVSLEVDAGSSNFCELGNTPMSAGIPLCP